LANNSYIRPDWDDYFLEIAKGVSKRATCLRRRYGAVITKNNIISSTGYNGSPRGEVNCVDSGICVREKMQVPKGERYELCVGVHAEQNAIINADPLKMEGATIYIAGFNADGSIASGQPCLLCRRMIKNAKIAKVVYTDKEDRIVNCKPNELQDINTVDDF
jgi:dCMP deaminase